jgi:AhpD family alkylhydroperoxidase
VKAHYDTLRKEGMTTQELMAIGRIAAVVNSIGKIAI